MRGNLSYTKAVDPPDNYSKLISTCPVILTFSGRFRVHPGFCRLTQAKSCTQSEIVGGISPVKKDIGLTYRIGSGCICLMKDIVCSEP